jgi:hypothetical protein
MNNEAKMGHDMRALIADHMEAGFLENIIDMFLHDPGLYNLVGELIQDERVRVRVGVTAMMEDLAARDRANVVRAVPHLLPLLDHPEAVVRGDASNLLGIAGDPVAVPLLRKVLDDADRNVRLIAREAIEEITLRKRRD